MHGLFEVPEFLAQKLELNVLKSIKKTVKRVMMF